MEKQKTAIQMKGGIYAIDGKRYIPGNRTAAYVVLLAGLGAGGLILSGKENEQLKQENVQLRQNAAQNPLELTCEQLSERGFEARGADGNTYKIVCEDYKVPAMQERGK